MFIVIDLLRDRKQITAAVHAAVTAERQRCLRFLRTLKRRTLHHDPFRRDFEELAEEIRGTD